MCCLSVQHRCCIHTCIQTHPGQTSPAPPTALRRIHIIVQFNSFNLSSTFIDNNLIVICLLGWTVEFLCTYRRERKCRITSCWGSLSSLSSMVLLSLLILKEKAGLWTAVLKSRGRVRSVSPSLTLTEVMVEWRLCNVLHCLAKRPTCVKPCGEPAPIWRQWRPPWTLRSSMTTTELWTFKDYHDSWLETMWNFLPVIDNSGETTQSVECRCTPTCLSSAVANCNGLVSKTSSSATPQQLLQKKSVQMQIQGVDLGIDSVTF